MRILVTSDSHGRSGNLLEIFDKHINDTNLFVNLGDSNSGDDLENIEAYYKGKIRLEKVCGNCDFSSTLPTLKMLTLGGKKIMICHGHTLQVKFTYQNLIDEAKERGADIALFGHTHEPYSNYVDGLYLLNPGAVCDGRYGIVDIAPNGIVCSNFKIV